MRKHLKRPDKTIVYTPPELGKTVTVSYFLKKPMGIESKILRTKKNILLIVDSNLDQQKENFVFSLLKQYVKNIHIFKLRCGSKSFEKVQQIWGEMLKIHPDVAVALGGGTTCDMVGFAASCYHRGLDHIFFPTTLLSMVDACIGGKTGIDFGRVKNSIGQIHYALESYCIFPFLKTLEYDELISGLSEVIKVGMLFDNNLIQQLERLPEKFAVSHDWFVAICQGAEIKANISEKPFSQRSKLLYGHNMGHGLETLDRVHRRHGDCVAIGMNYELAIAVMAGIVHQTTWIRQEKLLKKFHIPTKISDQIDFEQIKRKMQKYKLYKDNKYLFVIPKIVGSIYEATRDYYWKISESQFSSLFNKVRKFLV